MILPLMPRVQRSPVQESKPTDERVITALMTVYRLSGDDDAAIRLIEGAVAQQPDSEGLNKELHFCYLNSGKLPDMQKLSMKLFKSQSNAEYAAWAAITAHLSANSALADCAGSLPLHAALPMKAAMPLKVGGMMLGKGYPDLQEAPAAVLQLQVHTLRRQGDVQGAIDLLLARLVTERGRDFTPPAHPEEGAGAAAAPAESTPADSDSDEEDVLAAEEKQAGLVLQPVDALRELVELHCAAGQWAEAWRVYVALLLVCDGDDWAYITGLVEAVCMALEAGSAAAHSSSAVAAAVALCPSAPREPSASKCDALCTAVTGALAQEQPSVQGTYSLLLALQSRSTRPQRGSLLGDLYLRLRLAEAATSHDNAQAAAALEALPAVPATEVGPFAAAAVGTGLYASATAACVRYLATYGHKACAVPDLHPMLAPWGVSMQVPAAAAAGAGVAGAAALTHRTPWSTHPPTAEDWQRGDAHAKSCPVATPFSPLRRFSKAARTGNGYHGWASKPTAAAAGEAAFALGYQGHFSAGAAGAEQRAALLSALQQAAAALLPSAELAAEVKAAVAVMPSTKGDKGGKSVDGEAEEVAPEVAAANMTVSTAVDRIQSYVTVGHLSLVLQAAPAVLLGTDDTGAGADSASLAAAADKLACAWEFATSTHKAKAAQRGVLPGDELPLLAGELLVQAAACAAQAGAPATHSMSLLQQAVVLCEYALATSSHNFQLKLQGMRLYALLGNPVGHYLTFQDLDMKQVQYDSLQYLTLPTMTAFCQLEAACNVALRTCSMHKEVAVEVKGNSKTAYAKLNTAPALDFDVFGRRMENSLGLAAAQAVNGLMAAPVRSPVEAEQWLKGVVLGGEWRDGVMEQDTSAALERLVDNSDTDVAPPISIDQPAALVAAARWNRRQRVLDARLLATTQSMLLWALQHNTASTKDKISELGALVAEWASHGAAAGGAAVPVTAAYGGSGQPSNAWDVCAAALTHPGAEFGQSVWGLVRRVGEASAAAAAASKLGKKADWGETAAAISAAEAALAGALEGVEGAPLFSKADDLAALSPRFVSRVAMLVGVGFQVVPVLTADLAKLVPFTKKSKKGKAGPAASPSLKAVQGALKSFVAALLAAIKSISKSLEYDEKTPKASTLPEDVAVLSAIAVDSEDGEDTTPRKCFRLVARNVSDSLQGVKAVLQDRSSVLRGLKV